MPSITIDERRTRHIVRDAKGRFREDTDANRRLLIEAASRRENFVGTDRAGSDWYAESLADGTQIWVRVAAVESLTVESIRAFAMPRDCYDEKKALSPEHAFRAMFLFLGEYYERSGRSGDLVDVLSDIQLHESDGMPADPAAGDDWLAAINEATAMPQKGRNR
jgi:hypothetical protein